MSSEPLFMLDTDTCIFILRKSSPKLLQRLSTVPLAQQIISVVTLAELRYGLELATHKKANEAVFQAMLQHLTVRDWTSEAALHYGQIRATLHKSGKLIGANDLMIAAHARSLKATLVTNNTKDFGRVSGLTVVNWHR